MRIIENIDTSFDLEDAILEAERCKGCKKPICVEACPLKLNIPEILNLIRKMDIYGAYKELIKKNILAEYICIFCKERKLCTHNCRYSNDIKNGKSMIIDFPMIEKFIAERIRETGDEVKSIREFHNKTVAILGSNSCAITAAMLLARCGFRVTMYEKNSEIGGDMRGALTNFTVAEELVNQYERDLIDLNVSIIKDFKEAATLDIVKLRREFDFLIITSNFENNESMNIPGETECIQSAINNIMMLVTYTDPFLKLVNKEKYYSEDDEVVIIGGTTQSFDSARIVSKYSKNVSIYYHGDETSIGVRMDELERAKVKELQITYNARPKHIMIKDRNVIITFAKTKQVKKLDGRVEIVDLEDEDFKVKCQKLIIDNSRISTFNKSLLKLPGITLNKNLTISTDKKYQATNDSTVFAGGDVIEGGTSIIDEVGIGTIIANTIILECGGSFYDFDSEISSIMRQQNADSFNNEFDNLDDLD